MSEKELQKFLDAMDAVTFYNEHGNFLLASAYLTRAQAIAEYERR